MVGAVLGFIGFSAIAGLLVTIGVTPALAVSSVTASSSIGIFQSLPEYIAIGQLQQRNTLYGTQGGKEVAFATLYDQNRVNLKWDEVSPYLKDAAVDGEDRRFYEHGGVDLTSLVRAGVGTISKGSLGAGGGGSTLTMQLVKNIRLAQAQNVDDPTKRAQQVKDATDETVSRKLQEMKLAIGLEKKYSKDEILLAYLNIAYFGDQAYGVEAAAEHYYNKSAKTLTPTEAASLIAIVQYPESRDLSTPKNYPANEGRRNVILSSMLQEKSISQKDYATAIATKPASYVKLTPPTQGCGAVTWPGAQFFCDYVKRNVGNFSFLGATKADRVAAWKSGGYKVYTSINLDLTANAKVQIDRYAPNTETRLDLGGVVDSVEPGSGRVIVMAQNKNYTQVTGNATATSVNYSADAASGTSNGFLTGSTYKIFTLIDWLQKGHTLGEYINATRRPFTPMTQCGAQISTKDSTFPNGYNPKNDEINLGGTMNILTATAESVNVAYVAMAQQLDLCDIRDVAESMGVKQGNGDQLAANPSSVLGTNPIAPLSMAAAYATVAANGVYCAPIVVDKAVSPEGKALAGQAKQCKQVLTPDVAAATSYALQGVFTHGTAVGALPNDGSSQFGKTGTTNDAEQIWLIGSTTALTTVTWMGNVLGAVSLRQVSSPVTGTYATSRSSLFRDVQTVNDTLYKGTALPGVNPALLRGNGVTVPSLTGLSQQDAEQALISAKLGYTLGGTRAGALPAGQVSGSEPSAGSTVTRYSKVTIYTSDGTLSTVPTVTGKRLNDAISEVQNAGFDASKLQTKFQKTDNKLRCQVVGQSPAAGKAVSKDTPITVAIGGGKSGKDPGNCS